MSPRKIEIGKPRLDDVPDRILVDVRACRDRGAATFQSHMRVADVHRLVEAVVAPDLLDARPAGSSMPRPLAAAAAAAFRHRGHLVAHDLPLDRAARHEVHDDEHRQRDADERRDDQQEAAEEIRRHCAAVAAAGLALARTRASSDPRSVADRQLDRRIAACACVELLRPSADRSTTATGMSR